MEIKDLKIVLADDETTLRLLRAQTFISLGVPEQNIRMAENGEEAFALFKEEYAHIVWSDVQMPKKNGLELTKAVRREEQDAGGRTVIILNSGEDFEAAAKMAGADAFLPKTAVTLDVVGRMLQTATMCAQRPVTPSAQASHLPEAYP